MRIVSGAVRGRRLITPDGMDIRPTTDKVKEAMFSILQFDLPGRRVLDLFAGTGQLGLEALSRGAKSVTFTDSSKKAVSLVQRNIALTGLGAQAKTVCGDAFSFLRSTDERFDLVILDPPYDQGLCEEAIALLPGVLTDDAIVICETRPAEPLPAAVGVLPLFREYHYSNIKLTVYRKRITEED